MFMAAVKCCEYDWHVWREEEILQRNQELSADVFFIQIRTRDLVAFRDPQCDSYFDSPYLTEKLTRPENVIQSLFVKMNSLLYEHEDANRVVIDALSSTGVPNHLHKFVFEDVVARAWSMAKYPPSAGRSAVSTVLGFKILAVEYKPEAEAKRRRVEEDSSCT